MFTQEAHRRHSLKAFIRAGHAGTLCFTDKVPNLQRKAGGNINHTVCTNSRETMSHTDQSGRVGTVPTSKFPGATKGCPCKQAFLRTAPQACCVDVPAIVPLDESGALPDLLLRRRAVAG